MSQYLPKRLMVVVVAMVMFFVSILTLNSIGLPSYLAFAQNNDDSNKLVITDGIASGDVTDNSAIIWSRANAQSLMNVQYDTNTSFSHAKSSKMSLVYKSTDLAGQI